jgi:alginate O-acetyltransferase complex protein AlgI
MAFTSFSFIVFFLTFFLLYWWIFKDNLQKQNLLLLVGSYVFYSWADWRFLPMLIGVSALNYFLGIQIERTQNSKVRQFLLYIGLIQGIGLLAFFKYFNFFIESFNSLFHLFNLNFNLETLSIIVPLGISFFTFRTISYVLDVDKGKINATKDWVVFFNYVSFFPSLLSGPIDKAKTLIPQLEKKRTFDYYIATDGLRQILWGLFKKVVIADNCAAITNPIFDNYHAFPASSLILGAFLYTIQVYADFSGYSDMAIGFSRLIGFNITKNFDFPFFAQNIAEFWRKWHMSLTSWVTEYVFTPLSIRFRNYDKAGLILAIIINLTIVGIWHGAKWTNVLYGFLHGCYFIPLILMGTMNKKKKKVKNISLREFINMISTFTLVMLTFIVFRSDTIPQAFDYFKCLFSASLFSIPILPSGKLGALIAFAFILIMMALEWKGRESEYGIAQVGKLWRKPIRWSFYVMILFAIGMFMQTKETPFIYFQF